jgi:6,7-dimethyl-8-ribityllumazine synthase
MTAHFLLIDARYFEAISDELVSGAAAELESRSATYERISVPGVLELPAALAFVLDSDRSASFDGFVLLGCVMRGETTHYDIVANESARAIMSMSVDLGLAIGNGILTVENEAQAWARARRNDQNKGASAAAAAFHMVELRRKLGLARG